MWSSRVNIIWKIFYVAKFCPHKIVLVDKKDTYRYGSLSVVKDDNCFDMMVVDKKDSYESLSVVKDKNFIRY